MKNFKRSAQIATQVFHEYISESGQKMGSINGFLLGGIAIYANKFGKIKIDVGDSYKN